MNFEHWRASNRAATYRSEVWRVWIAFALFALAVGAVALSRAVNSAPLSDRILRAGRRYALGSEER